MKSLADYSKEELVQAYVDFGIQEEEVVAAKVEIREELYVRITDDGEVIGNHQVSKTKRISYPDMTIELARELGCTEEKISESKLRALEKKGVKIPHKETVGVRITEIINKEIQEKGEIV